MNMFKPTSAKSPQEYFDQIPEPRKSDIKFLDNLIQKVLPGMERKMWNSVIGYGSYHYKYKTGREGDWFIVGLASQKNYISLYICAVKNGKYVAETYKDKFPKASIGKSCIRFKNIKDIDLDILKKVVKEGADALS